MNRERGSTLLYTLALLFALPPVSLTELKLAAASLKGTSNYQTGIEAFAAADSGVEHARRSSTTWV